SAERALHVCTHSVQLVVDPALGAGIAEHPLQGLLPRGGRRFAGKLTERVDADPRVLFDSRDAGGLGQRWVATVHDDLEGGEDVPLEELSGGFARADPDLDDHAESPIRTTAFITSAGCSIA